MENWLLPVYSMLLPVDTVQGHMSVNQHFEKTLLLYHVQSLSNNQLTLK